MDRMIKIGTCEMCSGSDQRMRTKRDRESLLKGVSRTVPIPIHYRELVSSAENFGKLRRFAHACHQRRAEVERGVARPVAYRMSVSIYVT